MMFARLAIMFVLFAVWAAVTCFVIVQFVEAMIG